MDKLSNPPLGESSPLLKDHPSKHFSSKKNSSPNLKKSELSVEKKKKKKKSMIIFGTVLPLVLALICVIAAGVLHTKKPKQITEPEKLPEKPEETPEEPKKTPEEPKKTPEKPKETPEEPKETPEEESWRIPRPEINYPEDFFKKVDLKETAMGHSSDHPLFITKTKEDKLKNVYILSTALLSLNENDEKESIVDLVKLVTDLSSKASLNQITTIETVLHLMINYGEIDIIEKDKKEKKHIDSNKVSFIFNQHQIFLEKLKINLNKVKEEKKTIQSKELQHHIDTLYTLLPYFYRHTHMLARSLQNLSNATSVYNYMQLHGIAMSFSYEEREMFNTQSGPDKLYKPLVTEFLKMSY